MKNRIAGFLFAAAVTVSSLAMTIFASSPESVLEKDPDQVTEAVLNQQSEEEFEKTELPDERELYAGGSEVDFIVADDIFASENTGQDEPVPETDADLFREETTVGNENTDIWISEENSRPDGITREEYSIAWFGEENVDLLQAETDADQEFLEEIQAGEVIAVAPIQNIMEDEKLMLLSASEEGTGSVSETSAFTLKIGSYMNMDEVWTENGAQLSHTGTVYRTITYTDDEGVSRTSPVYCMNPSKSGPLSSVTVKEEAIKILSNASIRKILYYGYGGPGDISDTYDPTCSHCDWTKKTNRYVLTHYALSKVYCSDVSGASSAECEHVGLNRWIAKLTSYALPLVKDLKFYGKDSNGDVVSARNMTGNLTYYRNVPKALQWSGMTDGVQISEVYSLTASVGENGITITRASDAEWAFGYWTSAEDYAERGKGSPRVLAKGKSVTLYKGAKLRFAFPRSLTGNVRLSFTSILKPIQYIAISSNVQLNISNGQDLSTYYYEGARENLSLTFLPAPSGNVLLKKTADQDASVKIEGAGYQLTAAEDIVSNGITVIKKGEKLEESYTDTNGEIQFLYIPVGKYILTETGAQEGTEAENYLIDTSKHNLTVTQNSTKTVTVKELPDMYGKISIRKTIAGTELDLEGAVFTLYSWSKTSSTYTNGVNLNYNAQQKRYESETIRYTADNQGKFLVKETKNPNGFTGTFSKELVLGKLGEEEIFEYTAENIQSPRRVEITKLDSVTKTVLDDAEFTIFQWNEVRGMYEETGSILSFHRDEGRYFSEILAITDLNQGLYKIQETKLPEGYTGQFVKEINLYDENPELQFIVENTPAVSVKRSFHIRKMDSETGELLADAEFTVYQYNTETGRYEDTLGVNSGLIFDEETGLYLSAELVIDSRNNGKFKVMETKAPDGYTGCWEKEVILTEEIAEPLLIEAVNERERPSVGEILVEKKLKECDLVWAHGNPVFTFVAEGTDEKGNTRKYENSVCFSQDGYTVDENGYAVLGVTFRNVPAGQYQVYEKAVLYYYPEDASANTSNVNIVKGRTPEYGIVPREIVYGDVKLTAADNRASITFVNRKARFDSYIHNDIVKNTIPISFN